MQNSTASKFAPAISGDQRIDLAIETGKAIIKLLTWHDQLGWCGQKTLSLDSEMLDELHRVVAAARIRLKSQTDDASRANAPSSKVLDFPTSR